MIVYILITFMNDSLVFTSRVLLPSKAAGFLGGNLMFHNCSPVPD